MMPSNEMSSVEQNKQPFSAAKVNPFTTIEAKTLPSPPPPPPESIKRPEVEIKRSTEPLFTHEIPEVYNIMIKNNKTAPKT